MTALAAVFMLTVVVSVACDEREILEDRMDHGDCYHHSDDDEMPDYPSGGENHHHCLVHVCTCVHALGPADQGSTNPDEFCDVDRILAPYFLPESACFTCIDHPPRV